MQHMAVLYQMVADDLAVRAVSPAHAMVTSVGIRAVPIHAGTVEYRRVQCPQGLSTTVRQMGSWQGVVGLATLVPVSAQFGTNTRRVKIAFSMGITGRALCLYGPCTLPTLPCLRYTETWCRAMATNGSARMRARSQPSGGWTNPAARVRVDWRQMELAAKVRFASKC